ncbi:MAG: cobalamin-dependent protein [Clostridia bacterium]|nr:cobalamin-dependent protein [Clostridia bacterium]
MQVDLTRIKPYGDTLNDGAVQLSFTLPVEHSVEAVEAARQLAGKMGFLEPQVTYSKSIGTGFSFFVVYGKANQTVDFTGIKVEKVAVMVMEKKEVEYFIKENFSRPVNVVGACIESDAHTVGIDAIMNMKGFNGHKGLESYKGINAYNLGSQVSCEELVARAMEVKADAILVSQVVTQKDIHVQNLTKLIEIMEAEGIRDEVVLVVGGPRIDHQLAQELGYDAGFGPGTYAEHVASYIVQELKQRGGLR